MVSIGDRVASRIGYVAFLFATLFVSGRPDASCHAAPDARPNVLLISIDDLNDWVGFLGGHPQIKTPNMDRLARRGVVFANAHCASPLCCPSRASVFSGMQPFHTGVYTNEDDIRQRRPDAVLLPSHFKRSGYRTFGTGKLLHRYRPDLFDESFLTEQRWSPFTRQQVQYTKAEQPSKGSDNPRHVIRWGASRSPTTVLPINRMPSDRAPDSPKGESFDWGPFDVDDAAMGDGQVALWAAERLQWSHDRPFLIAIGFYRPHIPLFAPKRHFEHYPTNSIVLSKVLADDLADVAPLARGIALQPNTAGSHATVLKHGQWKEAVAAYLACVTFVDAQIGRLLRALEEGPNADNTVVVLWSDHGWHLGEKQHWGKWTGWERATRVPLVVVPAASDHAKFGTQAVCRQPVSLLDMYPTLVEMCGLFPNAALDGTSLVPLLRDPSTETGRAVVTSFRDGHYSVRDRNWRLIRYTDGSQELYDHRIDAHEHHNIASDPANEQTIARLAKRLPRETN